MSSELAETKSVTVTVTKITKFVLNVASIINIFLISTICPYTRNATSYVFDNVLWHCESSNASASEQSVKIYTNPVITPVEENDPIPRASSIAVCTSV